MLAAKHRRSRQLVFLGVSSTRQDCRFRTAQPAEHIKLISALHHAFHETSSGGLARAQLGDP